MIFCFSYSTTKNAGKATRWLRKVRMEVGKEEGEEHNTFLFISAVNAL